MERNYQWTPRDANNEMRVKRSEVAESLSKLMICAPCYQEGELLLPRARRVQCCQRQRITSAYYSNSKFNGKCKWIPPVLFFVLRFGGVTNVCSFLSNPLSDRQSLLQQMQQVGAAPLMQGIPQNMVAGASQTSAAAISQPSELNSISPNDYKFVFNNSSVGMAIASMGGAFVDCNDIFCQLSEYTKEEVCSMTIFNITARTDLQHAFDLISQMITPPSVEDQQKKSNTIVLRGAMKNRNDLGISVSLINGDSGIAKCFCVTLVKILSMESSRPDTVSIEMELPQVESKPKSVGFGVYPAYTSG